MGKEVTEPVGALMAVMQARIFDLHYTIGQTKMIVPVLSGIKILYPILSIHLDKC